MIEVSLTATVSQLTAQADIIARGASIPAAASHVIVEVKTGVRADIRTNQQYIYALGLVGNHLITTDLRLSVIGLTRDVPLPAMDFIIISADPPNWTPDFGLILASEVNKGATLPQIMANIGILESR